MSLCLFPHQVEGTEWMLQRERCKQFPGGLLLDDCGLGKTPQVIHVIRTNPLPMTLIVAPVNILKQWKQQLHRWVPEFKVLLMHDAIQISPYQFKDEDEIYDHLYLLANTAHEEQQTKSRQRKRRQKNIRTKNILRSTQTVCNRIMQFIINHSFSKSIGQCVTRKTNVALRGGDPLENKPLPWDHSHKRPLVVVTSYGKLVNNVFERVRLQWKRLGLVDVMQKGKVGFTIFNKLKWDRIVLDESHVIRNFGTTRTRYVMSLKANIKWCLTATPVHNGIQDYFCLLRFLGLQRWDISVVFGSHPALQKYLSERDKQIGRCLDLTNRQPEENGKKRKALTHDDITLRRTKRQVFATNEGESANSNNAPTLPPISVNILEVPFATETEMQLYEKVAQGAVLHLQRMGDFIDVNNVELREQFMFELVLRLRQCSVNPALLVNGYQRKFQGRFPINLLPNLQIADSKILLSKIGIPSKTRALCEMLKQHCLCLYEKREKAIVFCEFREEMASLQTCLSAYGIRSALYDGTMSSKKREEIVNSLGLTREVLFECFSRSNKRPIFPKDVIGIIENKVSFDVVIVQINSGNAGLNLQMCSRVYFTSPNWNPCIEIQAISRAHRCGQTKPVIATKIVLSPFVSSADNYIRQTIDQRILYKQSLKRSVMADILGDYDLLENGQTTNETNNIDLKEDDARFLLEGV